MSTRAGTTFLASVSAYTASEAETDATPDITANGDRVYDGGIACPARYEFGAKIRIGDRVFTCNDRMHSRYRHGDYFDIFMSSRDAAIHWGRKQVEVTAL
jgi:3D (Asp-Asp-Asp) domain-containing protein